MCERIEEYHIFTALRSLNFSGLFAYYCILCLLLVLCGMKIAEGVTEELQAVDPMAWAGTVNNIRNRAEESIRWALLYLLLQPVFHDG